MQPGCQRVFGLLTRRHHCRRCGGIFCDAHSRERRRLKSVDAAKDVRVCDVCVTVIGDQKNDAKRRKKAGVGPACTAPPAYEDTW